MFEFTGERVGGAGKIRSTSNKTGLPVLYRGAGYRENLASAPAQYQGRYVSYLVQIVLHRGRLENVLYHSRVSGIRDRTVAALQDIYSTQLRTCHEERHIIEARHLLKASVQDLVEIWRVMYSKDQTHPCHFLI